MMAPAEDEVKPRGVILTQHIAQQLMIDEIRRFHSRWFGPPFDGDRSRKVLCAAGHLES